MLKNTNFPHSTIHSYNSSANSNILEQSVPDSQAQTSHQFQIDLDTNLNTFKNKENLRLIVANSNSIKSRKAELAYLVFTYQPDIILVLSREVL